MDKKCSNAYSKYILSGLSLYLKYINKAICTINIQYVLSRTSGKCKNTVTIQCKYPRSTQLQVAAAVTTEPPLPEAWPAPPGVLGAVGVAAGRPPAGGSCRARHMERPGRERHTMHKGKPPAVRAMPSAWMAHLPRSGSRAARPTARMLTWRVLLASGSGSYLPKLGSVCPTYTEKTDNSTTPSPFIILDFLFS